MLDHEINDSGARGSAELGLQRADAAFRAPEARPKWRTYRTILLTMLLTFISTSLISGAVFYLYWEKQRSTPQYSLALMIDAARNMDEAGVSSFVDIDAIVDGLVPQVAGKAVEMYGRGVPQTAIQQMVRIAQPLLPAVKERARRELPQAIRSQTADLQEIPFAAMVIAAHQYVEISVTGDTAVVKSRDPGRNTALLMERNGERWKIVGVQDDALAQDIARSIGQDIIDFAVNGRENLKNPNEAERIERLLREAEEILR